MSHNRPARVALSTVSRGPAWPRSLAVGLAGFVVFRLATELVGVAAAFRARSLTALLPDPAAALAIWRQWDANWMVDIAQRGYRALSHVQAADGSVKDGTAFPPAMPLLLRAAGSVGISPTVAGLAWSGLFLLLGLAVVYRLSALDFGEGVARGTVLLLLAYPFAFFLVTGYAEALVLLATVAAFYAGRRRLWLLAGIAVGVALLAKIAFVVLLLPLTLEWAGWGLEEPRPGRRGWTALAALWLPAVAALGGWMFYLQAQFGEPLRFLSAQRGWGRAVGLPVAQVGLIFDGHTNLGIRFIDAVDLLSVAFLGVMAVYAYRRLRPSYGVLLGGFFVLFAFNTSLESNGRHLSVLFPLFLGLAVWTDGRPWLRALLVVAQLPLAVLLTARFATGHWAG